MKLNLFFQSRDLCRELAVTSAALGHDMSCHPMDGPEFLDELSGLVGRLSFFELNERSAKWLETLHAKLLDPRIVCIVDVDVPKKLLPILESDMVLDFIALPFDAKTIQTVLRRCC